MYRKFVSQFLFASSLGLGGYFIGQHSERRKCSQLELELENKFLGYCTAKNNAEKVWLLFRLRFRFDFAIYL